MDATEKISDVALALREMRRALRPGGRVAVLVWGRRAQCGWAEVFPIVDARVQSDVCPLFFQLGGEGVLERELAGTGFGELRVERLGCTLSFAGDDDVCAAVFEGGPVALAYARFNPSTRRAAETEFLASIAAHRRDGGYAIPGEFVLAPGSGWPRAMALTAPSRFRLVAGASDRARHHRATACRLLEPGGAEAAWWRRTGA